ncbi:MAG: RNA chaperone Hfq [Bacillota bacterium]
MTKSSVNLQDHFLNQLRRENVQAVIYLINGFQLRGSVRAFDNFTVALDSDGKQVLVYKHAISSIYPARPVSLVADAAKREEE